MRAAVLTGHGGPDRLVVREDVVSPSPVAGEVRVAVRASSVNNTDIWSREGAYGTAEDPDAIVGWRGVSLDFPRIQGADIVGMVDDVGDGVDSDLIGRRVLVDPALYDGPGLDATPIGILGSEADGGFAEFVVVSALRIHDVSVSPLSDHELAALPTAYGTAMGVLARAEVAEGETLVVTGASGGVGTAAVQLGAAFDARVIAVSTSDKEEMLRSAGALGVVDRRSGRVADQIRQLAPEGVDVVVDVVGGEMFATWPGLLAPRGRIVVAGAVAGPIVTLDLRQIYLDQRRIIGSTMHTPEQFERLVGMALAGQITPLIAAVFPLSRIHEAQRALRDAASIGKVVVEVAG